MLTVTYAQLEGWLALFFWPFLRITGLVATAPLFSHRSLPMPLKIGLCFVLTVIISPTLPELPNVPILSWASVGIIIEQLKNGVSAFRMPTASAVANAAFLRCARPGR